MRNRRHVRRIRRYVVKIRMHYQTGNVSWEILILCHCLCLDARTLISEQKAELMFSKLNVSDLDTTVMQKVRNSRFPISMNALEKKLFCWILKAHIFLCILRNMK